ncbi:probable jasmonic acid carboxyl methyltransferase 2 [Cornus florida]|uniref:probable jasmonic acid carboxyl methyltransferase 2 n=1 Tax=Cornus florida TaxID=4283 RepID=UPI0028A0ACBA|nr:probable jasmonic acid carboxyl methyltransferase 2 [Cornus florida]
MVGDVTLLLALLLTVSDMTIIVAGDALRLAGSASSGQQDCLPLNKGKIYISRTSQVLVQEEKIDSFNAPFYTPSPEELKNEVEREGSFLIYRLESFEIDWDGGDQDQGTLVSSGQSVAKTVRAVVESMLECHFGRHIMDDLFRRYSDFVDDHLSKNRTKYTNLVVSMSKI